MKKAAKKGKSARKAAHTGKTAMKIGAGLAAAGAAAAAGYYFYGSKKAKSHRKVAAKWAVAMQKEVVKEAKHTVRKGVSRAKKIAAKRIK